MAVATQVLAAQRAGSHEGDGNDVEAHGQPPGRCACERSPDDVEGWIVLARSYEFLQRYDDAVVAYQKAMALAPGPAPAARRLRRCAGLGARRRPGRAGAGGHRRRAGHRRGPSEGARAGRHGRVQAGRSCAGAPALGEGAGGAARRIPTRPGRLRPTSPSWMRRESRDAQCRSAMPSGSAARSRSLLHCLTGRCHRTPSSCWPRQRRPGACRSRCCVCRSRTCPRSSCSTTALPCRQDLPDLALR